MASAHSEAAKMEQIITEFYAKTLQIILESRCGYHSGDQALSSPSPSSSTSSSSRDKWFNLALRESPAALESSGLRSHSNLEPMVVDIVLAQTRAVGLGERVIERWVVRYENKKASNHGNRRLSNSNLYKKTILLLRSLYVTVRLLPAYKIYHGLNSSSQIRPFTLAHRDSSFVEPFSRKEEADMQRFVFTPVDTFSGRLCLCVQYHPWVPDITSSEPSTPMSPQLIFDYVGSPLTDPLKSFPSVPVTRSTSLSSPSSPFARRHSWSFDVYRASSPSPTHRCMPPHPLEKSDPNFDEFFHSPSLPIRIPGSHLQNSVLRSDSAPVHIQNLPPIHNKFFPVGKEETRQCSGLKLSSNSSPRMSCSSQSLADDFELGDFDCPFDETTDPGSRAESLEQRGGLFVGRKSQDAAVGELVLMLKKAQPLHQDESYNPFIKTTADALQELQAYRDLKNLLLTQGTISHI